MPCTDKILPEHCSTMSQLSSMQKHHYCSPIIPSSLFHTSKNRFSWEIKHKYRIFTHIPPTFRKNCFKCLHCLYEYKELSNGKYSMFLSEKKNEFTYWQSCVSKPLWAKINIGSSMVCKSSIGTYWLWRNILVLDYNQTYIATSSIIILARLICQTKILHNHYGCSLQTVAEYEIKSSMIINVTA